jgi:NAD(P)H-nitrite reductase large subunit
LAKAAWRSEDFYKEADIEILKDEVKSVDFGGKTVKTSSGKTIDYNKLILASGASPRWLPLPGLKGDLENVFVLRTLPHAQSIMDAAGEKGEHYSLVHFSL